MEPKNCPFCNGDFVDIALERSFYSGIAVSYVYCSCGARGPIISSEDVHPEEFEDIEYDNLKEAIDNYIIEDAILKWNIREVNYEL